MPKVLNIEDVRERIEAGESDAEIAAAYAVTERQLTEFLNQTGHREVQRDPHRPAHIIASDDAFIAAMRKAIKGGDEQASEGVKIAPPETFIPARFYSEATFSGCGSSAFACLDE